MTLLRYANSAPVLLPGIVFFPYSMNTKSPDESLQSGDARFRLALQKSEAALRESETRFKVIAETAPVGIGVVSIPEGNFAYVNPAYETAYGYGPGELLGKATPDIYCDLTDRDRILGILKEHGRVDSYKICFKRKDGTPFWGLSSIRPIIYGGKPALLGIFTDISEHKKAEDLLQRNTEELQKKNRELEQFNRILVGRELRMIELKKQVNELCAKLGVPPRYTINFDEEQA